MSINDKYGSLENFRVSNEVEKNKTIKKFALILKNFKIHKILYRKLYTSHSNLIHLFLHLTLIALKYFSAFKTIFSSQTEF